MLFRCIVSIIDFHLQCVLVLLAQPCFCHKTEATHKVHLTSVSLFVMAIGLFNTLSSCRYVTHVSFSPDGNFFVTGSNDKSIKVWKVQHGGPSAPEGGFVCVCVCVCVLFVFLTVL